MKIQIVVDGVVKQEFECGDFNEPEITMLVTDKEKFLEKRILKNLDTGEQFEVWVAKGTPKGR